MTQDNDDILALVWSGVSLPTDVKGVTEINHNNHTETTHFESSHVETTHYETHKESRSESKIVVHEESHIDNHDDLLESVRRATNSFREFVESSGVVEDENHGHHHEESYHLGSGAAPAVHLEHHEEHYEGIGIGSGVEPSHAHIGMGAQIHDDHHDGASVISARTGVSIASSVSVHSSVSQKSSVKGYDGISANGPDLSDHDHKSECLTEHTHQHESTICSGKAESVASTLSQSTLVQNYEVKVAAESNSHASTPVVPAKSATHDAVIEQFKHLHQRENSVCSSIQPSEVHLEEESVCSEESEEGRVMEVKVTKYNFDDDSVKQVSNVLTYVPKEHTSSVVANTLVHHEELKQEPFHQDQHYDAYHDAHHESHEEGVHHYEHETNVQVLSYNQQEINTNHHGSEDEFGFEHVEYVEKKPRVAVEEKPRVAASGVSVKSANVHVGPKLSHNVYETRRSIGSTSSSNNSTVVGGHVETVQQHVESVQTYQNVVHEEVLVTSAHKSVEHRDLVPNNVGPRVREDFRPVKIHREEVVVAVTKKPVIAHVQPVVATQPEIIEHHVHDEKHYDAYEEHHHHEHHHEEHEHFHSEIVHSEPAREEEVMYGPSVRDLKSIFDHGEPVNVHYGYHSIHHGATQKKHEIVVGELNHYSSHVEPHHEEVQVHHQPEVTVHVEEHVHQQKVDENHSHKQHVHKHHHYDKHEKKHRRHHSRSHSRKEHHHHEHQDDHVHKHHHHEEHHAHKHHHQEHIHSQEHVHQEPVHVVEQHIEVHEVHVPVQEYHAVEESVIPVSDALAIFGGGIRLRRPDHVEEQKSVRSSTQTTCTTVNAHVEEEHNHHNVAEVPETHVVGVVGKHRADTIGSGVSGRRSHAPTLTLVHQEHVAPVVVASPVAPAPVAAQRSSSNEQYQSVRVVKSVRNFVSQWGNKDFVPPQSPIISVPRLPVAPKTPVAEVFVEPPSSASRKSTVTSCSESVVSSKSTSIAPSTVSKSSRSSTVTSSATTVCSNCPICLKQASSKSSKRSSVASTVSTTTVTSGSSQSTLVSHVEPSIHNHIHHESEDDFEIVPVSERRALFEREHRSFSASFGRHGELPPMVNLRE